MYDNQQQTNNKHESVPTTDPYPTDQRNQAHRTIHEHNLQVKLHTNITQLGASQQANSPNSVPKNKIPYHMKRDQATPPLETSRPTTE